MIKLHAYMPQFGALELRVKYLRDAARLGLKLGASEAEFIVRQEARTLVPVDTGRLRDAIHAEHTRTDPDYQVWEVSPAYPEPNKYGFGPPYARRIEFGFTGRDSLGRFYDQAPRPFMRPAHDNKKAEALAALKRSILDELENANAVVAGRERVR